MMNIYYTFLWHCCKISCILSLLWFSIHFLSTLLLSCCSEVLSSSEHAAQLQRSEILEECEQGRNCCYTLQSVEKVMKKVTAANTNTNLIFRHFLESTRFRKSDKGNHINCTPKLFWIIYFHSTWTNITVQKYISGFFAVPSNGTFWNFFRNISSFD